MSNEGRPIANHILFDAVKSGVLEYVKSVISRGCDINQSNVRGITPLMAAINGGQDEIANYLCKSGASINIASRNGETAIYVACDKVNIVMVKLLLDAGCDVNAKTNESHPQTGRTPLMAALPSVYEISVNGKKEYTAISIVKLLLSYGCDVDARDWSGSTALHLSAENRDVYTLCILAENGADLHIRNNSGLTAFEYAIQPNRQRYEIAAILLLYGYDIEKAITIPHPLLSVIEGIDHDEAKYFPAASYTRKILLELMLTIGRSHYETMEQVNISLKLCSNISLEDKHCCQRFCVLQIPETLQCHCRRVIRNEIDKSMLKGIRSLPLPKSIKRFLALNFDLEGNDPVRQMEISSAIRDSDEDILKQALSLKTDLNINLAEHTPLTEAAKAGNVVMCKLLIENGARIDFPDNTGMTALHWAIVNGHTSLVEQLVQM